MSGLVYSVALRLRALDAAPARATGHHTYGLALRLLAAGDAALAAALHDDQPRKPLTVSALLTPPPRRPPPRGSGPEITAGPSFIRVTLLNEAAFSALALGVLRHPPEQPVMVGGAAFRLEGLETQQGAGPQVQLSSFASLWDGAQQPAERLTVQFLSPAVFRSKGARNALFPEPGLVFGGLLDKWNAFCPPELRLSLEKAALGDVVRVDSYRLATESVAFGKYRETGICGWAAYQLAAGTQTQERQSVRALAALALFAGVGAKTTMGLGQAVSIIEATRPAAVAEAVGG
ncbi:MAG: CRISPR system precrRNA processing endoribonuclease RAMP protein Cas6 [Chloroflexi bacterium]|nr:CRISPR system precrRNA processing endoribonuclease RAMP protein Cas6 [Chloroflexota bacterium]